MGSGEIVKLWRAIISRNQLSTLDYGFIQFIVFLNF